MTTILMTIIKAILGLIWFFAAVITTIILSPFILVSWISRGFRNKADDNDENNSNFDY